MAADNLRYRLRITQNAANRPWVTYIVRKKNGDVVCMSVHETTLALSDLIHDDPAGLRFKLEDAPDGTAAARLVQEALTKQWINVPDRDPKVEVL